MKKRGILGKIVALIALLILGGIAIYYFKSKSPSNTLQSDLYLIKGIDVSHHNAIVDWRKVKHDDITFAYIKATEGTDHEDRNYSVNYKLAKDAGILVGAYHFYVFATSGKEQANHFISTAKSVAGDLIPAIDVEHSATNPHSYDSTYVQKVIRELKVLEIELHLHYGARPIIYANKECYKLYIDEQFTENIIWIGNLDKEPSTEIGNWRIWQFSHTGKVNGILGKVDLNYYRNTQSEFSELLLSF